MTIEKLQVTSMPRSRKDMTNKLNSLKDTIQEHITKLVFFRFCRQKDVFSWLSSLNKHLIVLRRCNEGLKGKPNWSKQQLLTDLKDEFSIKRLKDNAVQYNTWEDPIYPKVDVTDKMQHDCFTLLAIYVDCILEKKDWVQVADVNNLTTPKEELPQI